MPFKSEAQRRFLFANHPQIAKRWAAETPKNVTLPYHKLMNRLGGGLTPPSAPSVTSVAGKNPMYGFAKPASTKEDEEV